MANAIVLEVLDFVRPIRLQVERIALVDVVSDAISLAESHVPRGDVSVNVDVPEDLAPIQGDPHQLRQLFTNLLTNAFEALGGKGPVTLSATQIAPEEEPTDRGRDPCGPDDPDRHRRQRPGRTGHVIDRIFSPFFTTKAQGSGLGLAIVRKSSTRTTGGSTCSRRPRPARGSA